VLLVGDDAQIPTKMLSYGASDASYSLMDGDNRPELIVGRFSAETESQVTTMVTRSIAYEKMNDQPWFHNGIGIASTLSPGDDGESDWSHLRNIRTSLLGYNYSSISELYEGSQGGADASGDPTASMVSAAVNSGVSIINYTGHGLPNSWGTTGFDISNVNSLTNDNKLPFIFSTACDVGGFTNHLCFAESWLRAKNSSTGNPTGAIAFYGASDIQTSYPPMEAQDKFNSLLVSNSYMSFGALCYNASCQMMDVYGNDGVANFLTWNIFGDPSINLKRPSISGSNIVCSSGATFTINNFPSDASVSWSGGPYLSLSSQSGNSATFTVIGNGDSPVRAIIYPVNPGSCQINLTKTVWVGKPILTSSVTGPSQLTPGLSAVYSITPTTRPSTYSWQIPSGCYYNYCWHITSGQGTSAISVQAGAIGSGAVQVTASNGCPGNDSRYMYVTVQNPSDPCDNLTLSITPNPSLGGDVVIDVIQPPCDPTLMSSTPATLSVIDNMGTVVYSKKHTGNKIEIKGLKLTKGLYHVVYIKDNRKFEKSMIVE